jgi:hypothetical protein
VKILVKRPAATSNPARGKGGGEERGEGDGMRHGGIISVIIAHYN